MQTETLDIIGMTCAACAKAVERAVGKVGGVSEVSVNLATEKMAVTYDPTQTARDDIKTAVKKAGYEAREAVNRKEITIPIEGMT